MGCTADGGLRASTTDAKWCAWGNAGATASAPTIATVAGLMSSELTMWAAKATRMGTAATTTAAILTTATHPPITMAPGTTVGLTIRCPHRLLMDGVGAGRRGTATTVLTSSRIRCIRRLHFG